MMLTKKTNVNVLKLLGTASSFGHSNKQTAVCQSSFNRVTVNDYGSNVDWKI